MKIKHNALFISCFLVASCGSGGSNNSDSESENACLPSEIESTLDQQLASLETSVDFSFAVKREDGRQYIYNRGGSTLKTSYQSASTSKLIVSVAILRLVEQGYLSLTDSPQDYITDWPIESTDPLYNMTLAQLLSFTSGLEAEPLCVHLPFSNFESCVNSIATANDDNDVVPNTEFHYASTHMQVAGMMAYKAAGATSWEAVFEAFKSETGLFENGAFDLPSSANPRLAGGMHWTGEEYMAFLEALKKGELLDVNSMTVLLEDRTSDTARSYSPAYDALTEDWHYGLGLWHECQSNVFDCAAGERISSPGTYGAYPYWDRQLGYIGLVARQGSLFTFKEGVEIERAVRGTVEEWVACS